MSYRQHSVEPSGGGYLYGYEVDTRDAEGASATVLTFVDTDPGAAAQPEFAAQGGGHAEPRQPGSVIDPGTGRAVRVWAYPADPSLPALATVTYPETVTALLARLGVTVTNPELSVASYRPGKRAVVRVDAPETTLFLKVVRPNRAEPIADQHRAFAAKGLPVPGVLAVQPDGLLVLTQLEGAPAGSRVVEIAEARTFVDGLVALAESIADVGLTQRAQADALDNGDWHRRSLTASLPGEAARISRLYDRLEERRRTWSPDERQVVHGDLHFEQLFVDAHDAGRITGLLDIDTAGVGHPARDAGALVAHLVVTAQWHRGNGDVAEARACERIADDVVGAWTARYPAIADRLPVVIASQLLAHAGGQAALGTDLGREKARQLIEAAEGTLAGGVVPEQVVFERGVPEHDVSERGVPEHVVPEHDQAGASSVGP